MTIPTEDQIADAVASAHWWTRRGVCRDGCACDGCVSSSVMLYLYEQYSRNAPGHTDLMVSPESLDEYLDSAPVGAPSCPMCDGAGASTVADPKYLCGRHYPQWDAEDCGHV